MRKRRRVKRRLRKRFFVFMGILLFMIFAFFFMRNRTSSKPVFSPDEPGTKGNLTNSVYKSHLVAIDAGHGGNDDGTSGFGLKEKNVTLDICLKLEETLNAAGVNTFMIRDHDKFMDRRDRIKLANNKDAELYISVHCDWFEDSYYNGVQTIYYPTEKKRAGNLLEKDYAKVIQTNLIKYIELENRGIKPETDLAVLKNAVMPSVLVELGFLSNKNDAQKLNTEDFRQKAANALAKGIEEAIKKLD